MVSTRLLRPPTGTTRSLLACTVACCDGCNTDWTNFELDDMSSYGTPALVSYVMFSFRLRPFMCHCLREHQQLPMFQFFLIVVQI